MDVEEELNYVPFKYCIVPKCTSTTIRTPGKIFFQVPKHPTIRRKWCTIMRRDPLESNVSTRYCCEDYFELQDNMSNYWKHKLMKSAPRLKGGVVPRKFSCQKSIPTAVVKRMFVGKWGHLSEPQPNTGEVKQVRCEVMREGSSSS